MSSIPEFGKKPYTVGVNIGTYTGSPEKRGISHYYIGTAPNVLGCDEIPYSNTADPFCTGCS